MKRRIERIATADARSRRIGHFSFFRDAFEPTLWQRALEARRGFAAGATRPAAAIHRETAA